MVNFGEKAKMKRQEIWIQVVVVLLQLYLPPPTHICTFSCTDHGHINHSYGYAPESYLKSQLLLWLAKVNPD